MTSISSEHVCGLCGKPHAGLPTDSAYTLPDVVWDLPEAERAERAKWNSDLCQFGERYFIRCLLEVPFLANEAPLPARLANDLPTYGGTLGLDVLVQFRTSSERPAILFSGEPRHTLAAEVRQGMSHARFHEVLIARGLEL